jgi:hypothetical protein
MGMVSVSLYWLKACRQKRLNRSPSKSFLVSVMAKVFEFSNQGHKYRGKKSSRDEGNAFCG